MAAPPRAGSVRTPGVLSAAACEAGMSLVHNLSIPKPFSDPSLESLFLEDHSQRFCAFRCASTLLALFLWTCFLWWDFSFARANKALNFRLEDIVALRMVGFVLLIISAWLVLKPSFRSHVMSQRVILVGIYGLLCLILALFAITPAPYNYTQHFTGLCLALFVQFSFFYLRARVGADGRHRHDGLGRRASVGRAFAAPGRFLRGHVLYVVQRDRGWSRRLRARGARIARAFSVRACARRAE